MASFAEIKAKMDSKYGGTEKEDKKRQEKKEQKRNNNTASATSNFESIRSEMDRKYSDPSVDESYVNTFVSDANKYLNSMQSDYDRIGATPASSVYQTRKKAADDLGKRSSAVRRYLEQNKTSIGSKDYDGLMSFLDDLKSLILLRTWLLRLLSTPFFRDSCHLSKSSR